MRLLYIAYAKDEKRLIQYFGLANMGFKTLSNEEDFLNEHQKNKELPHHDELRT